MELEGAVAGLNKSATRRVRGAIPLTAWILIYGPAAVIVDGESRDVAPRVRQALARPRPIGSTTTTNTIGIVLASTNKRADRRCIPDKYRVRSQIDQLFSECSDLVRITGGPAKFDPQIAAFYPPSFVSEFWNAATSDFETGSLSATLISTPTSCGGPDVRRASAARGQAAATPPRSGMKSRRLMGSSAGSNDLAYQSSQRRGDWPCRASSPAGTNPAIADGSIHGNPRAGGAVQQPLQVKAGELIVGVFADMRRKRRQRTGSFASSLAKASR